MRVAEAKVYRRKKINKSSVPFLVFLLTHFSLVAAQLGSFSRPHGHHEHSVVFKETNFQLGRCNIISSVGGFFLFKIPVWHHFQNSTTAVFFSVGIYYAALLFNVHYITLNSLCTQCSHSRKSTSHFINSCHYQFITSGNLRCVFCF